MKIISSKEFKVGLSTYFLMLVEYRPYFVLRTKRVMVVTDDYTGSLYPFAAFLVYGQLVRAGKIFTHYLKLEQSWIKKEKQRNINDSISQLHIAELTKKALELV